MMKQNLIDVIFKNTNLINAIQNVANFDKSALYALCATRFSFFDVWFNPC